jgi:hypothetical protein
MKCLWRWVLDCIEAETLLNISATTRTTKSASSPFLEAANAELFRRSNTKWLRHQAGPFSLSSKIFAARLGAECGLRQFYGCLRRR